MKLSRWLTPGVAFVILATLTQPGSSTMIMGSMLLGSMAANTAMMLGKMSLGGLMMMMLSQQNGGGGGDGRGTDTPGLLQSLGNLGRTLGGTLQALSGQASNTNKRTTRSHAAVVAPAPVFVGPMPSATATTIPGSGSVVGESSGTRAVRNGKVRYARPYSTNPPQNPNHNYNSQPYDAYGQKVKENVQSWPASPTSSPVQIQSYAAPSSLTDEQIIQQLHQEMQRHQKQMMHSYRKRVSRSAGEATEQIAEPSSSTTTTSTSAPPSLSPAVDSAQSGSTEAKPQEGDDETVAEKLLAYTRLMRQADTFDYMSCLPKFVCGLEAQPPTKKTSILNDYSHLLKLLFGPDEGPDDDELDDELPSDEELNPERADAYRLNLGNKERMDERINDELIEEDPDMLGYVLKDIAKRGNKKNKYDHPPMGHYYPSMDMPVSEEEQPEQSSGFLSSFLPKISAGFGSKTDDPTFDSDPFFSGFKRSLDMPVVPVGAAAGQNANEINVNDFDQGQNVKRSKRISDNSRKRRKREAVEEILKNDPVVKKYARAQEIGRSSRRKGAGQRDCSNAFKGCPYAWDQIMGMISNMRETMLPNATQFTRNQPPRKQDKVVVLKVPGLTNTKGGSAIKTYTKDGAKLTHDLGDGNVMQITLKLAPKVSGFEQTPVVESEPYQENDELDIDSVALLPSKLKAKPKPKTTTAKPKPADEDSEESDEDLSEEQSKEVQKVTEKLQSQNVGDGPRPTKPKRTFKPAPASNFDFASDVDMTGINGATILPKKGKDKVVHLKTTKVEPPSTTTEKPKPSKSTTTTTIKPIGSASSKKGQQRRPGQEPVYKIKRKEPVNIVVELPKKKDEKPAASYKDDDASSEEDDESDGDLLDDDLEAAEDEFILDDRDNYRAHGGNKKKLAFPLLFSDAPQRQQSHEQNYRPTGPSGSRPQIRRPLIPYPMMRKPPIMHDPSGDWPAIGERARALSSGQQQQQPQLQLQLQSQQQ